MGRPCSKLRKTGSYPMDLDTVEEHDRHASPGAVDSSDTEMKEVSRQQSSQHGSADEMNKSSVKKTNKGLKLKKPKKRKKSKSDKTEDSHYVTEAKKIILEKSEDMNIDDAKSTRNTEYPSQKVQQEQSTKAESEQEVGRASTEEVMQQSEQEKKVRAETERKLEETKERLEKIEGGASEIKVKPAKSDLQNSELEKKLAEKDSQLQRLEKLEGEVIEIKGKLAQTELENSEIKEELAEKDKQIRRLEEIEEEASEIKEKLAQSALENSEIKRELAEKNREIERKDTKLVRANAATSELNAKLTSANTENEKLLTRLSELAGARLLDGNPNIADLSDINRPTKLSEQYSELYDNEWTDAFSYLTEQEGLDEKRAIQILLTVLQIIYQVCQEKADKQIKKMHEVVSDSFKGSIDVEKKLKESRKKNYKMDLPDLKKTTEPELLKTDIVTEHILQAIAPFHDECLRICWLMCIQDPPVYVDCETNLHGERFSKDRFKTYTKAGQNIDFLVWPSAYLHKDGVILFKGVVECMQSKDDSCSLKPVTALKGGAKSVPVGTTLDSLLKDGNGNHRDRVHQEEYSSTENTTWTNHRSTTMENTSNNYVTTPETKTLPIDITNLEETILPEDKSASEDRIRPFDETPSKEGTLSEGNTTVNKESTEQNTETHL